MKERHKWQSWSQEMDKVLIIGRLPPPVGGVTMHIKRLTDSLNSRGFGFTLCNPVRDPFSVTIANIIAHKTIHIHFSRPALQLGFAVLCQLCHKKLIITYHGQWERYKAAGNLAVRLSATLAAVPIVQDQFSFKLARRMNRHAKCISTFIPPLAVTPLPDALFRRITEEQKRFTHTFCTNAWKLTYDKAGRETYGISEMVSWFSENQDYLLLLSDPSGTYMKHLAHRFEQLPVNVLIITTPHDFGSILKLSDALIRNTSTDGISLSIHEARALGVPVLASGAVARPAFCGVFDAFQGIDMPGKLTEARQLIALPGVVEDSVGKLANVYDSLRRLRCKGL